MKVTNEEIEILIVKLSMIEQAAQEMLNDGLCETEIICPSCGHIMMIKLDYCCGVEGKCEGCNGYLHKNMGLNFHDENQILH